MKRLRINAPVLITTYPAVVDIIDDFQAKKKIYYCADEYSALPGYDPEVVEGLEKELLAKVDVVLVTSRALQDAKGHLHNKTHYLPHGVNYQHLRTAVDGPVTRPGDVTDLQTPLIGYVGLIGEHLDFRLIDHVARSLPDATVVMIGPVQSGLRDLPTARNIAYLGPKPYVEVPNYLAYFDVCILPWNDGERNKYAHPAKLREYLASGCAVVSTAHPEVCQLGMDVYIGRSYGEFSEHVRQLITTGPPKSRAKISSEMQVHDWSKRAGELLALIGEA